MWQRETDNYKKEKSKEKELPKEEENKFEIMKKDYFKIETPKVGLRFKYSRVEGPITDSTSKLRKYEEVQSEKKGNRNKNETT